MQLHPATAGIGAAVAGAGGSDPAPSTPAPWRPCSHQKEAANKTQNALILQHDIAVGSTEFSWNIRWRKRVSKPKDGWTYQTILVAIAKLGGYIGRRSDGPPGWQTIWRGWQRLLLLVEGFRLASDG